jgi:type IV secretion system protein VirB11
VALMLPAHEDSRLLDNLRYVCGDLIMGALENPEVIEVMLNDDGKLWIEKYGRDHEHIGVIAKKQAESIMYLVASGLRIEVGPRQPRIEGVFPLDGSRFEGFFPPLAVAPGFTLRKRASRKMPLSEYAQSGSIRPEGVTLIENAVAGHENIVVVGGTSSGKTTFVNAVIDAIDRLTPHDRVVVLEDTAELQCNSRNTVSLQTSELADIDMRKLARMTMRLAPKRIVIGEVRDFAALEMLKLWDTGHPGGVSTFHADSAVEALQRLESLVEEAGLGPKRDLIGRAVGMVVYMTKTRHNTRVVDSIIKVTGYDPTTYAYKTENLYAHTA